MNISGISDKSLVGKALRLPLRLIPSQTKMPIMQGRLRGKKWIVGSGQHGYWLGSYEYEKRKLFEKTVRPGSVVYDLGGHVGFYTLLSSEIVGPDGKVFVFEPVPRNLYYIREHLRLNNVCNVSIIEAAVSNRSGVVRFSKGPTSGMGHIASEGELEFKAVSLDELYSKGELPLPNCMKIDIEGGEMLAIEGAKKVLAESHPTIFLATHGTKVHKECCEFLRSLDYQLTAIDRLAQSSEVLATYAEG